VPFGYQSSTKLEPTLLPSRLTWIDETNRGQHVFLQEADRCYFFGEYFAYKGYNGGPTNQLIFNFKCAPSKVAANPARGSHKERAVSTIATGLRRAITRENAEQITWVPIPPSKAVGDPDYDDRLLRTLKMAFQGYDVDIRSLVRLTQSTQADHNASDRLTPEQLYALLEIDRAASSARPLRGRIVLFDDLLTTGKHFKCCVRRLREVMPDIPIVGLFVARRVLPDVADEFEDLSEP
jgi:hypothetical protein